MKGYKTYLTAGISIGYAIFGYLNHSLDAAAAISVAQVAVMGAFIRHGVSTGA